MGASSPTIVLLPRLNRGTPGNRKHDQLRSAVGRIGLADHVPELLESLPLGQCSRPDLTFFDVCRIGKK